MPRRRADSDEMEPSRMGATVLPIFPNNMGYSDSMAALLDSKKSLVLSILEEHFGDIVRDVAYFLLNTANVTLALLVRSFGSMSNEEHLSAEEAHFALRQLMRHGYLLVEAPPSNFANTKEQRANELELAGEEAVARSNNCLIFTASTSIKSSTVCGLEGLLR